MAEQPLNVGLWAAKLGSGELGTILAGFAGGLVTLRFLGPMPWWERLVLVAGGTVVTYYLTPLAVYILDLPVAFISPVGFLIGVFGMSAIGAALSTLSAYNANPLDWLRVVLHREKAP